MKIPEVLRGTEQRSSVDTALCKVSRHQGTCSMVHSIGNVPVLPVDKKGSGSAPSGAAATEAGLEV